MASNNINNHGYSKDLQRGGLVEDFKQAFIIMIMLKGGGGGGLHRCIEGEGYEILFSPPLYFFKWNCP